MSHPFASLPRRALVPLVALSALACDAATLRVPSEYATIQRAIDAARQGDTVFVAPGTYVEALWIHDKALTLESEAGAANTTIDGDGEEVVVRIDQSVDDAGMRRRVAGFTIRNATWSGIMARGDGRVDIENNILAGNNYAVGFGAIDVSDVSGSIRHNLILKNKGRGIQAYFTKNLVVEGNHIEGNDGVGLEIANYNVSSIRVKVIRNVIRGNAVNEMRVSERVHIEAADNLVVHVPNRGNYAVSFDAPMTRGVKGHFVNNTIGSTAWDGGVVSFSGGAEDLEFANNVIYSQSNGPALKCLTPPEWGGVPHLHHNDAFSTGGAAVEGYCVDAFALGEGNVSVDPGFATDEGGSPWKLRPDSPLIDAGSNDAAGSLRRDIRGVPRIVDGGHGKVVDMGAFEYLPK